MGRCWAVIRLSHRPEPSGHAVHGKVDGLDIGGQHGRRFVFLRHTHRPQRRTHSIVQAGAETPDTGAEAVKPDPGASWDGHSRGGCRCRGWISFFCFRKKVRKAFINANVRQRTKMSQLKMTERFQWKKTTGPSTPTGASKPPQECDAWCQLLAKWLDVSAIRERPVQRYSEVFGIGAEGQGFRCWSWLSAHV